MPDVETQLEPASKPIRNQARLTHADIALILKLHDDGRKQTEIAQVIGCNQSSVSEVLKRFSDTRDIAKRIAHNASEKLMRRVISQADVDQSLEVLDRTGVLEKRQESKNSGINIAVGISLT